MRSALILLLALLSLCLPATAAAQSFSPQPARMAPDLTANLAVSASTVGGGEQVTYTLSVQNVGQVGFRDPITGAPVYFNAPASNISALQTLPAGALFRSVAATAGFACAYIAPVVTCTGGSLASGSSAAITVVASAPLTAGSYSSTASVDATNAIVERSEGNNTATASVVVPQLDLAISANASATSIDDSSSITYFVHVDNPGPAAEASNVTLRYALPNGATLWSYQDGMQSWLFGRSEQAGFTCATASGVVTCTGGRIPSGGRGGVTLNVRAPRMHGSMTNTFAVDPNNSIPETNESNNTTSISTNVVGRVDLSVEVTHSILPIPIQRIVTVRNLGAGPASNVRVEIEATKWEYYDDGGPDTLVGMFADSGFTCTRAAYYATSYINYHTGDVITCTGGSIPAGGAATIRLVHWLNTVDDSRNTTATVDPQNAIRESFENNNTDTASTRI
jgi:hypothetical protein